MWKHTHQIPWGHTWNPINFGDKKDNLDHTVPFILLRITERIMHGLQCQTIFALTRGLFWCLCPELWSNAGNKHQNNTRVGHKQSVTTMHTLYFYTTWVYETPCPTCSVDIEAMTSQMIVRCIMGPSNCDASTWEMICNSLDSDFIHGYVHGWSCQKVFYWIGAA